MIQLFLDGKSVALFTDTDIGITALNPYFNAIEAFSFPFTIPYKPNEQILKYANRIQGTINTTSFIWKAVLIVDSVVILRGDAVADGDFQDGAFPITLRSSNTSFIIQSQTLELQQMDFGTDPEMDDVSLKAMRTATLAGSYPANNYVCAPFYNTGAWSRTEVKFILDKYINNFNLDTQLIDDAVYVTGNGSISPNTWVAITYSFYVRYILKRIIELMGYTLGSDDMETIPDLNRWFLLSFNRIVNGINGVIYKGSFPLTLVSEFFKALRSFGIAVIIDETMQTVSIKLVRDLLATSTISKILNGCALNDILEMSMPTDGYTLTYNGSGDDFVIQVPVNIIPIDSIADLPDPTIQYSDYSELFYSSATQRYYMTVLQDKIVDTDADIYYWKDVGNCRPFIQGNGEAAIELSSTVAGQRLETRSVSKSYSLHGEEITISWDIGIEMPEINQKINSYYSLLGTPNVLGFIGAKYSDPPLVFLFNWGLKNFPAPTNPALFTTLPIISGDAYARDETEMGSISMRTSGPKSIVEQLVKPEQDWILRRKSKRQFFRMTIGDYAQFQWDQIQNIDSVNYFVNSLKFDITKAGISLVEAELFTV